MIDVFLEAEDRPWSVKELLDALSNPCDREILALAQGRAVDAQEIMDATGSPKSTVYRRLRALKSSGLLIPSSGVVRDGHAVERYRASVESLTITMAGGDLEVRWRPPLQARAPRREDRQGPIVPPPIELATTMPASRIEQAAEADG